MILVSPLFLILGVLVGAWVISALRERSKTPSKKLRQLQELVSELHRYDSQWRLSAESRKLVVDARTFIRVFGTIDDLDEEHKLELNRFLPDLKKSVARAMIKKLKSCPEWKNINLTTVT